MKTLVILGLLGMAGTAYADDINCQTINNITSCHSTSTDYSYLHNAGQDSIARAGYGLGQILAGAMTPRAKKTVVNAVLEVNCGKAIKLVRIFADGKLDESDMGSVPVSDLDIATIQASLPMLQIIRGCEP